MDTGVSAFANAASRVCTCGYGMSVIQRLLDGCSVVDREANRRVIVKKSEDEMRDNRGRVNAERESLRADAPVCVGSLALGVAAA